jgi:methenyltetrahydromethanopterin cyclohydrolase
MLELGFDVARIATGAGRAPLAPIAKSDMRAIGRTNDCILYGGVVHLSVDAEDAELEAVAPRIPSSSSRDYGTPFYDVFKRYDSDFYKIDPLLFSPAQVTLASLRSGRSFTAGRPNAAVLRQSLLA